MNNKNLGWFAFLSGLGAALVAALELFNESP